MKGNYKSLVDFATEIERVEKHHKDYIVKTQAVEMKDDNTLVFGENDHGVFSLTNHAHGQVAGRLEIPKRFYDRVAIEHPGLRSEIVNRMFKDREDKRMIRTIDGTARAFVSDKFRPYDNHHVMASLMPSLKRIRETSGLEIGSCSLTERKLFLEVTFPGVTAEVRKGDVVRAGMIISNSEVGSGSLRVEGLIWRMWCTNGAISKSVFSKHHVGRRVGGDVEDYSVFKDETIMADLKAFQLKLRDIVENTISRAWIEAEAGKMRQGLSREIKEPEAMVKLVQKQFDLQERESKAIYRNLCEGKEYTQYGLGNSITALARELEDKDRAYDLQKTGYKVLTLPGRNWNNLHSSSLEMKESDEQPADIFAS